MTGAHTTGTRTTGAPMASEHRLLEMRTRERTVAKRRRGEGRLGPTSRGLLLAVRGEDAKAAEGPSARSARKGPARRTQAPFPPPKRSGP